MQTAFYGYHSLQKDEKECWRSDILNEELELIENDVVFWDYLPAEPESIKLKNIP